ncbi:MAG: ABC transporter permease [Planctomycetota bacterium]|nr:ABC transporter permease [Planctomycetota bacterium]
MTQVQAEIQAVDTDRRIGRSLWADAARRIRRDIPAMICLSIIIFYTLVALSIGFILPGWADNVDYDNVHQPPSSEHWFGTDEFGRDVLQKTLLGSQVSMTVGFMANIIAIPLGMILGAIAGYYGGRTDDFIVWIFTTLAAIPGLIRIIAVKFAFQGMVLFKATPFELDFGGMSGVILALSITGWIGTCRLVRAETLKLRELDYVLAARASGRRGFAILIRHVIPNVTHLGIINFSLGFIGAVAAEVTLTYLGLGVEGRPSWGQMITDANMGLVVGRWWQITAAGTSLFILVLALNIFGDRLRDALDPKLKTA